MFTLFLNPFTMLAGFGLVSAPIIIHLINRLRFRRVRWAAMEFLLKAEKRNRRKLLIEQLILLILRCLIVLLLGLLLARFVSDAFAFARPLATVHLVLLDDSASMGDRWSEDGQERSSFAVAQKAIIDDIAIGALSSSTPQQLTLLRFSDLNEPYALEQLKTTDLDELRGHLANLAPTPLHLHLRPALERAKEIAGATTDRKVVIHIVSDFRAPDWTGSDAEAVTALATALTRGGARPVALHLLDVAHPFRTLGQKAAPDHGNAGILDLQPDTRVAAKFMPVEFVATVANYGAAERKNVRLTVKVNGQERADSSTTVPSMPPGVTQQPFTAVFDQLGWNRVTAILEGDEAGLKIDDMRHATVEVRERVPLLFVEGDWPNRQSPDGDSFFLRALFLQAARGYEIVQKPVAELEALPLELYPAVYLFNVPRLSDKAQAKLETFARGGGGVFFALGDKVSPEGYNLLYNGGRGLFPVPLDRATEPLTDAQKQERLMEMSLSPKVYPRGETHPVLARIYRDDKTKTANSSLPFLAIDRYFPVPRARWTPEPGRVAELLTLPNGRSMDDFKERGQRLINRIPTENGPFAARLKDHARRLKDTLGGGRQTYALSDGIDAMLLDAGDVKDPARPSLLEFWRSSEQAELRAAFVALAESARYGDPLLVAQRFGQGRVLAYLTTAGTAWNNWPNGPANAYFVPLMLEAQKYLAAGGADLNLKVGQPWAITADAVRYAPTLHRYYFSEAASEAPDAKMKVVDLREQAAGPVEGGRFTWPFAEAIKPGVYRFDLKPRPANGVAGPVEPMAYAFNVDTAAEGDLRRAASDELESAVPGATLHAPGGGLADLLKEKRSDLSETPWLFLALLLVLVAEQALAVRLSFHLNPTH